MATRFLLVSLLIFALSAVGTWATVTYTAVNNAWNTPGGRRFNRELGVPYTEGTLASSTHFVWQIFNQASPADRRNVHQRYN
ncbi:hypothetical protein SAY87_011277 [Trapa incisa]|uniref:Uncharacterized protein n=1 Tax=Trapa incisa TaxID=236973 RepID=A0AAN7GFC1_9MYRT|nr:hypothetical protein SAY87_011277 [Trapa incisa]